MNKSPDPSSFERNPREASRPPVADKAPMITLTMNRSDWGILLFLSVIWGAAFFFIGVAVREVPAISYVFVRLALAAAALWLFLSLRGAVPVLPRRTWGALALLAVLNNALPFVLIGWSETQIASGLASILNATTPIFGVIVAHFFTQDERVTPTKIVGVAVGFAGVAAMLAPTLDGEGAGALAITACLIASLCYALAGVWARRFKKMGLSAIAVSTGQLTLGAVIMLPVALVADRPWTLPMPSVSAWGAIAALAIVCTAFAYILYFRLIERAGATNALLVTLLVPVTAVLLGTLFLNETLAWTDFLGMGMIAIGLAAIDGRLFSAIGSPRPRPAA